MLCNHLQNVVATTYIFRLQLSTFIFYNKHRYALIINDSKYIELQTELRIPNSQYRCIKNDLDSIVKEFEVYLRGYIKAVKKNRNEKEPLYRESSLINFVDYFDI